ncbi:hypothetical protein [Sulfitobacter sp. JL08]|jgi:hypothetical protein|uniref:hypothetical protein n=1 Tax=unclassified Sulfitobacter TaxID=196795 RepID=UPI000E0B8579|nr:hypothetical protein [Sulfitobacter sp. JL08]AXI55341.1 hypothetical protein C1J05_13265 [Sulfitobacter sp. JL08]
MLIAGAVSGCEPQRVVDETAVFAPDYQGVTTQLLQDDLVNFQVAMTGARTAEDVAEYAECAAAQYTLIRGYGFARHLRTNVQEEGGVWVADAVYTISPSLPDGSRTLDAEVVTAHCAENGIPTV